MVEFSDEASLSTVGSTGSMVPTKLSKPEVKQWLGVLAHEEQTKLCVDGVFEKEGRLDESGSETPRVATERLCEMGGERGILGRMFHANARDFQKCVVGFGKLAKAHLKGKASAIDWYPVDSFRLPCPLAEAWRQKRFDGTPLATGSETGDVFSPFSRAS